ncbi:hypothetical protein BKA69DRAFT_536689 [Paraphysoderma sedebokerense]|nr:hypothetical protein BKA69DRAFT_536689 [Paraphysoderma sedebokerense]
MAEPPISQIDPSTLLALVCLFLFFAFLYVYRRYRTTRQSLIDIESTSSNPQHIVANAITDDQKVLIEEFGVLAWKFVKQRGPDGIGIMIEDSTKVLVHKSGEWSISTNLPIPVSLERKDVYYFETTITSHLSSIIYIGLTSKPCPARKIFGRHKYSLAYCSLDGKLTLSTSVSEVPQFYGPTFDVDDTIGLGYISSTATVFFTKNGTRLRDIETKFPVDFDYFPVIGVDVFLRHGAGAVSVNFGYEPFVWDEANTCSLGFVEPLPVYTTVPRSNPDQVEPRPEMRAINIPNRRMPTSDSITTLRAPSYASLDPNPDGLTIPMPPAYDTFPRELSMQSVTIDIDNDNVPEAAEEPESQSPRRNDSTDGTTDEDDDAITTRVVDIDEETVTDVDANRYTRTKYHHNPNFLHLMS